MENRVLFHRVANTLNYLDIRTVLVSCGTCMDQLLQYEFERIFPGCRLLDIHEYLMEKGITLDRALPATPGGEAGRGAGGAKPPTDHTPAGGGQGRAPNPAAGVQYLYHDPCHGPMKTHPPLEVATRLLGQAVTLSDRCCGEAGTLGTARPDIASQLRYRKEESLVQGIRALTGRDRAQGKVKLLTSCPACQQGLAKYADDTGLTTDYIVVELARKCLGHGWQGRFLDQARAGGIDRVLL
jgi:Fe-S oxidoreductase